MAQENHLSLDLLEIPENKVKQLEKKGFNTLEDLASFYPKKYHDFRTPVKISELMEHLDEMVCVIGNVISISEGRNYVRAMVEDGSGATLAVFWFHQMYLARTLQRKEYVFCGKVQYNSEYKSFTMASPVSYSCNPEEFHRIFPVYGKVKGMSSDYLENCIQKATSILLADTQELSLSKYDSVAEKLGILPYKAFLLAVHSPSNEKDIAMAQQQIAAYKLLPFAMKMEEMKRNFVPDSSFLFKKSAQMKKYIKALPFTLTKGQADTISELSTQANGGERIDVLVQGDVGCGKTAIAVSLAVNCAENGYQAAIMCPTGVLAEQHYRKISAELAPLSIKTVLLESGLTAKVKKAVLAQIESGEAQIVIGTHSIISDSVKFKALALTIIDEEHRFGVDQRNLLREKSRFGVHSISMSATPIPRTIAVTIYGEKVKVINIKSAPTGRKPINTILYQNETKVYQSIYNQIKQGHQAYIVCPLIEDSDSAAMTGVDSAETTYEKAKAWFSRYPEVKIDMVTGNMKPAEIKQKITDFAENKTQIIISTTIIEVGIDVPNATVILIKNAERFGLAQLHQLRGRVGRGKEQSYCVLLSQDITNKRLIAMTETTDGFEIAQKDLELRGTGDVIGTKQSGVDECISLMLQNAELYEKIVGVAGELIDSLAPL